MNQSWNPVVGVVLSDDATMPEYAHDGDTGADLFSSEDVWLWDNETKLIGTGVRLALPEGWGGFILEKSGLALKGIQVMGGVIDSGYRGEVKVILRNLGMKKYITKGMKIAQIEIRPVYQARFARVEAIDVTSRNDGGFGSTGT